MNLFCNVVCHVVLQFRSNALEQAALTCGFTQCSVHLPPRAYIANRVTDKLTPIHERIYCCRSGSAADTQAIADAVTYQLGFHRCATTFPPPPRPGKPSNIH